MAESSSSDEETTMLGEDVPKYAYGIIGKIASQKTTQLLILLLFEVYQGIILIFFFSSISFLPNIFHIVMNAFMWIYLERRDP